MKFSEGILLNVAFFIMMLFVFAVGFYILDQRASDNTCRIEVLEKYQSPAVVQHFHSGSFQELKAISGDVIHESGVTETYGKIVEREME